MFWLYLVSSFFIVACGQPARVPVLGLVAAMAGFAFFWRSMLCLDKRSSRFFLAFAWFFGVQAVQLSWMATTQYMGPLILVVYLTLCLALGLQFGLLSLLIRPFLAWHRKLAIAGLWTLLEWSRLYICSGFTWNPAGLSLACSTYSLQMASLFGVYGLSFWVMWVNLTALRALFAPRSYLTPGVFIFSACLPFLVGAAYLHRLDVQPSSFLRALLVQTALLPEQKDYDANQPDSFIPLAVQWETILGSIEKALQSQPGQMDLIVLPEGALSYGAYRYQYDMRVIEKIWEKYFGLEAVADLPALEAPQARLERGRWKVTNAYWAQAIASHYKADLVIGLDDEQYNAAFLFHPEQLPAQRYEKRILVPVSEYIPFGGSRFVSDFIADQFDIRQSFSAGTKAKLFQSKIPLAVSICYEETYGQFSREGRIEGAELLVNITNDAWFPSSSLAQQHFDHGMIRSVENGVPVLRACNTGVTGGVDRFGRTLKLLPCSEQEASSLILDVPMNSHPTLYTLWGDAAILWASVFFVLLSFLLGLGHRYFKNLPLN
ncbi:MAG TPA: apolipoprotein N-acyltransferase [Parachlamydiales bacterium]|nr:apolipoprotein N-acyltransferase [Parachlamydiales bacterium]